MLRVREHRCDNLGELRKLQEERQKLSQRIKDLRRRRHDTFSHNHADVKGRATEMFQDAQARLTEAFMSVAKLADDTLEELDKDEPEDEE